MRTIKVIIVFFIKEKFNIWKPQDIKLFLYNFYLSHHTHACTQAHITLKRL